MNDSLYKMALVASSFFFVNYEKRSTQVEWFSVLLWVWKLTFNFSRSHSTYGMIVSYDNINSINRSRKLYISYVFQNGDHIPNAACDKEKHTTRSGLKVNAQIVTWILIFVMLFVDSSDIIAGYLHIKIFNNQSYLFIIHYVKVILVRLQFVLRVFIYSLLQVAVAYFSKKNTENTPPIYGVICNYYI